MDLTLDKQYNRCKIKTGIPNRGGRMATKSNPLFGEKD